MLWHADVFRVAAINVVSDAFDGVTVFIPVIFAIRANAAGEHRVNGDFFANFDIRVAALHNNAGEFMSHDDRRCVVGYVASEGRQIGGTDAAQFHLNKHIPRVKRRDGLLLDAQLADFFKSDSLHVFIC